MHTMKREKLGFKTKSHYFRNGHNLNLCIFTLIYIPLMSDMATQPMMYVSKLYLFLMLSFNNFHVVHQSCLMCDTTETPLILHE